MPETVKPVLTVKFGTETHKVYLLNVGDHFPNFGGSRQGLVVGENQPKGKKTASIIYQRISAMGTHDMERNIYDPVFWAWIARLIGGEEEHRPDEVKGPE